MKTILAVLFVLSAVATAQTKHAPTVERCEADQKRWLADVRSERVNTLRTDELIFRGDEMLACELVDKPLQIAYVVTVGEYATKEADRYGRFLIRHNLIKQFFDEDGAGQR